MKTCKNFGENMEKNVLIYAERWCSGGIESLISNLVSNLDKSKFNIKILMHSILMIYIIILAIYLDSKIHSFI